MIVGILSLSQALESLAILVGVGSGATLDWIARTPRREPVRSGSCWRSS